MARPRKPLEDKYLFKTIRFPPTLWAELEELVPPGERSAYIQQALARALRGLRRDRTRQEKGTSGEGRE
jgi:hypothetical protein